MEHAINFSKPATIAVRMRMIPNQAMDRIIHFFSEDRRQRCFMDLSLNLQGRRRSSSSDTGRQGAPGGDGGHARHAAGAGLHPPGRDPAKLKDVMKVDQPRHAPSTRACFELYQAGGLRGSRCAAPTRPTRLRIKLAQGGDAHTLSQGLGGVGKQSKTLSEGGPSAFQRRPARAQISPSTCP